MLRNSRPIPRRVQSQLANQLILKAKSEEATIFQHSNDIIFLSHDPILFIVVF